jgi:hypothetical protein
MKFKAKVICSNKEKKEIEVDEEDRTAAISNLRTQGFLILELNVQTEESAVTAVDETTHFNKLTFVSLDIINTETDATDSWLSVNDRTRVRHKKPKRTNLKYLLILLCKPILADTIEV